MEIKFNNAENGEIFLFVSVLNIGYLCRCQDTGCSDMMYFNRLQMCHQFTHNKSTFVSVVRVIRVKHRLSEGIKSFSLQNWQNIRTNQATKANWGQ